MGLSISGTPTSGVFGELFNALGAAQEDKKKNPKTVEEAQQAVDAYTKMAKGGKVSSASKRADGAATKGKTRGKIY